MKKVILLMMVAVLGVATANAQFEKGTKVLFGRTNAFDLNFGDDITNINLNLNGSYFVIDNLAVTVGIGVDYHKEKGSSKDADFNFEVGARYYFWTAMYGALMYEGEMPNRHKLYSNGRIEVGYSYYFANNVYVEPAIYFNKGFGDSNDTSRFGLSVGLGVNF